MTTTAHEQGGNAYIKEHGQKEKSVFEFRAESNVMLHLTENPDGLKMC